MDVEYADTQSKADVDALRAKSKKFDKAMTKLENDHSVLVIFGQGNTAKTSCGSVRRTGGCTRFMTTPRQGFQKEFRVVLDPTGLQQDQAAAPTEYFDMQTVVGHEAYGHVVPGAGGTICNDAASGTPANQVCSVRRENEIRKDADLPLRTKY